ncbi:DUF4229 domain-containing protein [Amnibacterium endophyticum]|uniref:DUF4229 domain-containing protein n=1 Tax=Amnibacterium endophyticum TaxID=2109337 RepID=A0ABW4LE49_9MICO
MAGRRRPIALVWAAYTAFRLLLFAVPFLLIWGLSGNPTLSAVAAAAIGLALSVILLRVQREALARALGERVESRRPRSDEAAEDDRLDAQNESPKESTRP